MNADKWNRLAVLCLEAASFYKGRRNGTEDFLKWNEAFRRAKRQARAAAMTR